MSYHKAPLAGLVVFLIILVGIVVFNVARVSSQGTETCTVESKERTVRVTDGNSSQQKLVYTDCGVFEVADTIIFGKFNSADTYGSLQEGETYKLSYYGWRNGFFSMFPNITEAVKVTP